MTRVFFRVFIAYVKIAVYVLRVIKFVELIDQPEHLKGAISLQLDAGFGYFSLFGRYGRNAYFLQSRLHGLKHVLRGGNFELFAVEDLSEAQAVRFIRSWYSAIEENRALQMRSRDTNVEREYRADDEAPLIASVFYNRLKRNIGLESCATLEYIITEIQQEAHPEYITLEDEKIDSPYNTYRWAGLPPGPISNPGRIALEAAFHPARTGYLYFVLRDQQAGRHFFSRDLSEHNQAKYLYLKKS